jgi:hypothetical protein
VEEMAGVSAFGGTKRTRRDSKSYRETHLAGESRERREPLIACGAFLKMTDFRGRETLAVQYKRQTPSRWQVLIEGNW